MCPHVSVVKLKTVKSIILQGTCFIPLILFSYIQPYLIGYFRPTHL